MLEIASKTVCGTNQCYILMTHKLSIEALDKIDFEDLVSLEKNNIAVYSLSVKNINKETFLNSEEFEEKLSFFAKIYEIDNMLDTDICSSIH